MKTVQRKSTPSRAQLKLTDIGILLENCHWYLENTLTLIKKSRREIEYFKVRESKSKNTGRKKIKKRKK